MSFITAIGTAIPKHVFSQSQLADFMVRAMQVGEDETKKLRTIFRATGISTRASVLSDYGKEKDFSFYSNTEDFEPFPSTKKRNEAYRTHAIELSIQAVENAFTSISSFDKSSITHLITVSCTGFYAPGLDIDLITRLMLPQNTHRTCINFMGCYAAISAMKAAVAFCDADPTAKVLVVCTELCSLHFQKEPTEDNLLANALFSDGAAAVLVEGKSNQNKKITSSLFNSMLIQNGSSHMAWTVGDFGFEMKLSAYVSNIIEEHIHDFCTTLTNGAPVKDIKYLAVHPGGKKILATVEQSLGIPKEKNASAYRVLKNFGNMSSPTILFLLKEIFDNLNDTDHHEEIVIIAFGPGLTVEGALFKIEMGA